MENFFFYIKFYIFFINISILIIPFLFDISNEEIINNDIEKTKIINLKFNKFKSDKDAVLLMVPHHGNLGDQAIALGELKFLKEFLMNLKIIYNIENYTNNIHNDTIIFLHGGGNIGWTYIDEEKNRREIIEAYPNNNIIIFPQTIYFEDSFKEQQNMTSKIYSNHSKLIIMTREKVSYGIANNLFKKNKIILSPDIVTYLDDLINKKINKRRRGALFLLRNDLEKFINNKIENKFISLIKKEYRKCEIADTSIQNLVLNSIKESKYKVSMLLKKISKYEIVVTDRLHGMIFCALTETSCIVLKNYNHKVTSSYEWFKHLDFIKLINSHDIKELKNLIDYFKNKNTKNIYNKYYFENYYDIIRETITSLK